MGKTSLQDLNLDNDFLFGRVMSDEVIAKELLEKILDIEIGKIVFLEGQKNIDLSLDSKSIRLDVYLKDHRNTVYNVEIQRSAYRNLPMRGRYYQSFIALDLVVKGMDYKDLPKSFVIFICTFDLFGKGRCKYTFENRCIGDADLALGDGTQIIFLNSKGKENDVNNDLQEFLRYIENSTDREAAEAKGLLVQHVHSAVKEVKANKKMEVTYMTLYELQEELKEELRAEGEAKGQARSVVKLLCRFGVVPTELEQRILQEQNPDQLTDWLLLAAEVESLDEFLTGVAL